MILLIQDSRTFPQLSKLLALSRILSISSAAANNYYSNVQLKCLQLLRLFGFSAKRLLHYMNAWMSWLFALNLQLYS